ncbi:MAG: leucine-rich repeat protein [Blautia sp.]|nr:leucine-rich repeat protein [Blautia sp.]MCM1200446.1 leucine-rich repeat protein [Bacteroides fragilis]
MSKKTPARKSKRRLKRSVRRSLAAVLMITAIAVAAIPVPENVAAPEGGISALADTAAKADVHDMKDFVYTQTGNYVNDADGKPVLDTSKDEKGITGTNFVLNKYADTEIENITINENDSEDKGTNTDRPVYASLAIIEVDNILTLNWQFMYYNVVNPVNNSVGGVVCKYNSAFSANLITLSMNPITAYYTVETSKYDEFWYGKRKVDSSGNPEVDTDGNPVYTKAPNALATTERTYSYADYAGQQVSGGSGDTSSSQADMLFFQKYFPDDYAQATAEFKAYYDRYQNATGEKPAVPDKVLRVVPVDRLNDEQKKQYYCDNDTGIAGEGYTLRLVHDNRPNKTGDIYLAYGGTKGGDQTNDDQGYLVSSTSKVLMIAIGDKTFKNVRNVKNMTIPTMIEYIGDEAFADAVLMESIEIKNAKQIGNRAFKGCVALRTVELEQGTSVLGAECFSNTALEKITMPSTTTTIGYGAFANCKSLTSVDMDGIRTPCEIRDYAFYDCYALNEVKMENAAITSMGEGVFSVVTGSQQFGITMPRSMSNGNTIGRYMFAGRAGLEYVIFPQWGPLSSNNATIPDDIFHDCTGLSYVEFPAPADAPTSCGYVTFNPEKLFADIVNLNFYVKGPYQNSNAQPAVPRQNTWVAKTAIEKMAVPYQYRLNGRDYYEVSQSGYLLCVDKDNGMLISCTLVDENGTIEGGELEIPDMVGNTKVEGIATDCFNNFDNGKRQIKTLIIRDNSISVINDSVFENWENLQKVYIGNSVTKVGNNAFKGCKKLVDVTFGSPANGDHAGFTIGTDAFKTESPELTFHGDIIEGYAPFEWATAPDNIIESTMGIRVCYKSLSPSFLTVMYNPITGYVTLLDYPKYSQVNDILNDIHTTSGDIGPNKTYKDYVSWRVGTLYGQYAGSDFDGYRSAFARAWEEAGNDKEAREAVYNDKALYGPWVNTENAGQWRSWLSASGSETPPVTSDPDNNGGDPGAVNTLTDLLFEPLVVYAAEEDPDPYYDHFEYDVIEVVTAGDPYRPATTEELALVNATKNIVIPRGVDSIDVYGFRYNLDAEGEEANSQLGSNTGNYSTYFQNKDWNAATSNMYLSRAGENVVPGLFSGTYKDYPGTSANEYEKSDRGNDLIESVTMNSVKYLPDYAFDNCERLGSVILGPDCADIGKAPFRGCTRLQAVGDNDYYKTENGIVYSVGSDGSYTIEECLSARGNLVGTSYIDEAVDPNIMKVSAIKDGAFEDCGSVVRVDLRQTAGLLKIPESCFKNCKELIEVKLPDSVNSIQSEAFAEDSPITVTIPGREVFIATDAFTHNDQKVMIRTYPGTSAYEYATYYKMGLDDTLDAKCLVTFLDYDGTELKSDYIESGSYAEPPAYPEREKWEYTGWRAANSVDVKDKITEDTIFVAQGYSTDTMVDGKYKVEFFDTIDFAVLSTQYIEAGGTAVEPRVPEHPGYTFVSWNDTFTNIMGNKTIYSIFNVTGGGGTTNTSGGTTTTSGGTTNTSGGTTITSNRTTSTSSGTTSSSTSSSSTSETSTSATSTSEQAAGLYAVTVIGGSGSGTYPAGSTVLIMANEPAAGKQFSKWTVNTQGVTLANVSTTLTTFVMPSSNVIITAEFIDKAAAPTTGTVSTRPTGSTDGGSSGNNGNTRVDITKPGINNKDLATADVNGSTDNFVVKISETPEATQAVMNALTNKYGSLDNLLYYAMDISLYDSTGTTRITDTTGLTVDITIPLPDALITYGGNNMMGAVVSGQMEDLSERFTTINGVPCISFTATHFSPYTIYVNTQNLSEGLLDSTPKTGDPIHPKWFLSIGLACLSVILFMKKDRKTAVKKTA